MITAPFNQIRNTGEDKYTLAVRLIWSATRTVQSRTSSVICPPSSATISTQQEQIRKLNFQNKFKRKLFDAAKVADPDPPWIRIFGKPGLIRSRVKRGIRIVITLNSSFTSFR
jgi:hypothetical protein